MNTPKSSNESGQIQDREAQLLQELKSTRQELNDFVYIVSHDLKAPLRGIDSLANWLATDYADKLDEEGQELISLLVSRVKRLNSLLNGLLEYSRVGRIQQPETELDLNQLVTDIISQTDPPPNINIKIESQLPIVWAEPLRIEQIFKNLLSNAINYMDKAEGEIKIACVEVDNHWQFSITDSGPGIEEKHFARIFQIFQTLQPRDQVESSGVGLALVKKIVEMSGGQVWVESEVGTGSTFYFTLAKQEIRNKKEEHNDEKPKKHLAG